MPKLNKIPPLQQAEMAKVHSSLMPVPIFMILSESDTSHRQLLTAVIWAKSIASKHQKSFNEIHFKSFICYKQKTSLSFAAKTLWLYHQWANTRPAATATALDIPFRETRRWRGKVAEGEGEQERELVACRIETWIDYRWVGSGGCGGLGTTACAVGFLFSRHVLFDYEV